jgi:hypothetical protein
LVSFFYKKQVEYHKTNFFGDLGESGSEKMAGILENGVLGVPHGIPKSIYIMTSILGSYIK